MSLNARSKGANGERELCKWLKEKFQLDFEPERNLEQVRSSGADIVNFYPFYFECKRVEDLDLWKAWNQVCEAARDNSDAVPVVAFRKNRQPWQFAIAAGYLGCPSGYIILGEANFVHWARRLISQRDTMGMKVLDGKPLGVQRNVAWGVGVGAIELEKQ